MITKPKDECRPHAPPCNKAALRVQAHRIHDALDTRDGSGNGAIVIDVG